MRPWYWLAMAGVAAGCGFQGTPVPVAGDTEMLAGDWEGTYASEQTGRSGSITFRLKAGTDSAWGEVLMIPARPDVALAPGYERNVTIPRRMPQSLTISFVQCAEGEVTGRLDTYRDPDSWETVYTTFEGRLVKNRLEGTYYSYFEPSGLRTGGRWSVTRVKH